MSNKDVILVPEDTASLIMVPVKAVTADLKTDAGVIVYVPLATTKSPGIVQVGHGLKITDKGILNVDELGISPGIIVSNNDVPVLNNTKNVNFSKLFNVSKVDDEIVDVDGSEELKHVVDNYFDDYEFLLASFNNYYDKTYINNLIIDNLETNDGTKALSARQGVLLKDMLLEIPHAKAFDTIDDMVESLKNADSNFIAMGSTIRIVDTQVPDFWISGVYSDYVEYVYVNEETLINDVDTNKRVRIGYFDISKAEVGKIELDDYLKKQEDVSDFPQAYVKNENGIQVMLNVVQSYEDDADGVVRYSNGNVVVNTPTNDVHAVNKKYLDESLPTVVFYI